MGDIFIAIMEKIAEAMPQLALIDEDYGQLEGREDMETYPVTFPAVLIGYADSDWKDLGMGAQKSESMIVVRLAIDCYDDTHYTSGTYEKVRERQEMATLLYRTLQEFRVYRKLQPASEGEKPGLCAAGEYKGLRNGFLVLRTRRVGHAGRKSQ